MLIKKMKKAITFCNHWTSINMYFIEVLIYKGCIRNRCAQAIQQVHRNFYLGMG